jgi:hypothetical protein
MNVACGSKALHESPCRVALSLLALSPGDGSGPSPGGKAAKAFLANENLTTGRRGCEVVFFKIFRAWQRAPAIFIAAKSVSLVASNPFPRSVK